MPWCSFDRTHDRIITSFSRPWNESTDATSMRAYEVDKDGDVIVNIVVPHESDALEGEASDAG